MSGLIRFEDLLDQVEACLHPQGRDPREDQAAAAFGNGMSALGLVASTLTPSDAEIPWSAYRSLVEP